MIKKYIIKRVGEYATQTCSLPDEEWASALPRICSLDPIRHITFFGATSVFMARSIWLRMPDGKFVCLGRLAWGYCGRNFEYGCMTLAQHRIEFGRTAGIISEWRLDGATTLGTVCVPKWWLRVMNFSVASPFQITYPKVRSGILKPPAGLYLAFPRSRQPEAGVIAFENGIELKFKLRARTDGVCFRDADGRYFKGQPTPLSTPLFSAADDFGNFTFEEKSFLIGLALWPRIFYPINGEDPSLFKDDKIELGP